MHDFTYNNPVKIIFGKQALQKLKGELMAYGTKVFICYGKGSAKANGLDELIKNELKGLKIEEFWGLEPNPRVETVRIALKQAKIFKPDIILAVGGGSVIDGSKLLAASYYSNHDPWELVLNEKLITKALPLATVLTVAATGSEMNCFSVISNWDEHLKLAWESKLVYPRFSILDPTLTCSIDAIKTAYGISDVYSHVLEQYMNTTQDALLQDRWAEGILLTLIEIGPKLITDPQNYHLRSTLMFCSTMALNGIIAQGQAGDWATHNIEHELSAFYDIPHGAGLAVLTPQWLNEVKVQKQYKMAQYSRRVWKLKGDDREVILEGIAKTYEFFADLGIQMQLSEYGIDKKHFPTMIERLVKKGIGEVKLTADQISNILTSSL